jgi:hypothetical protein
VLDRVKTAVRRCAGPAARLDPISARRVKCAWAGTKSGASSRTKSIFGLQISQRLKNEKNGPSTEPENEVKTGFFVNHAEMGLT